ncbi:hypothetical protein ACP70R_008881 [Stipagrostis hirtigluma subsp. patula]
MLTKKNSAAMANRPSSMVCHPGFILLSLILVFTTLQEAQGASSKDHYSAGDKQKQGSRRSLSPEEHYVPVRSVVYRSAALPAARTEAAAYEPFEVCEGCRCCAASNASSCVDTSCCYAIDCDLPGKPFGVCAFTPRTCGCGADNCTQPS